MNGLRKCGIYTQWSINSAIKKNEIMLFAGKWMELEIVMLSKVSQTPEGCRSLVISTGYYIHYMT
jgi:hypothetical protein